MQNKQRCIVLFKGALFYGHYQVPEQIFISHSSELRMCQTGTIYGGYTWQAEHQKGFPSL